ncbi:hypothetical protein ACFWPJ_29665, partial [Nocardia sp. NPDC058497]
NRGRPLQYGPAGAAEPARRARGSALHAGVSEKISTRIKIRPELEKALTLAHEIKTAAPDQPVIR